MDSRVSASFKYMCRECGSHLGYGFVVEALSLHLQDDIDLVLRVLVADRGSRPRALWGVSPGSICSGPAGLDGGGTGARAGGVSSRRDGGRGEDRHWSGMTSVERARRSSVALAGGSVGARTRETTRAGSGAAEGEEDGVYELVGQPGFDDEVAARRKAGNPGCLLELLMC